MRKFYRYLIFALSVAMLGALGTSIYFYTLIASSEQAIAFAIQPIIPERRISLILNNSETLYWQRFKKGAMDAAAEQNIAIEFHGIRDAGNIAYTKRQMMIAIASQQDGVILNAIDGETVEEDIAKLLEEEIVVVTTGVEGGIGTYFVGTNAFEFGKKAARLAIEAVGENARIAIILDNTVDEITGFANEIQQHDDAVIEIIKKSSGQLIGSADIIQNILNDFPAVNVIICMSPEDSLAAAQAIVDRNLVGRVSVIGTDLSDTPTVRQYIDRNIIYGYIERNPYEAGFQSVEILTGILDGYFMPTYNTVDLEVITRLNLTRY